MKPGFHADTSSSSVSESVSVYLFILFSLAVTIIDMTNLAIIVLKITVYFDISLDKNSSCKETNDGILRIVVPFIIERQELDMVVSRIAKILLTCPIVNNLKI